jgi:hypothetical protein
MERQARDNEQGGAVVLAIRMDFFWTSPTKKFFPSDFRYPTLKTRAGFDPRATFALADGFPS